MKWDGSELLRSEELVRKLQPQVVVSRRARLLPGEWSHHLLSPYWRLYVNDRSGPFLETAEERLELAPHRIYVVPAWLEFRTGTTVAFVHDYIHFDWAGLPPAFLKKWVRGPVVLPRSRGLEWLRDQWRAAAAADVALRLPEYGWAQALVQAVAATMVGRLGPAEQRACFDWLVNSGPVRPALECIEERLADPPTNAELARRCGLSADHFIRVFRNTVGVTPARYSLERRLATASRWLAETDRTIDQIADDAGFTDRFHFSRQFKARFSVSPAAYRRTHREPGGREAEL